MLHFVNRNVRMIFTKGEKYSTHKAMLGLDLPVLCSFKDWKSAEEVKGDSSDCSSRAEGARKEQSSNETCVNCVWFFLYTNFNKTLVLKGSLVWECNIHNSFVVSFILYTTNIIWRNHTCTVGVHVIVFTEHTQHARPDTHIYRCSGWVLAPSKT